VVIRLDVDCPSLWWVESFMENSALIRRSYLMSE
jgi:hypothetical protein